jgi:hypothetical protein
MPDMPNLTRGFRRIAWLLTATVLPFVAVMAYTRSEHQVGYRATLLTSDFPSLDRALERNSIFIENLGIAYFPATLTPDQVDAQMHVLFSKQNHPEVFRPSKGLESPAQFATRVTAKFPDKYQGQNPIEVTKRVLAEYPVYRPTVDFKEFEISPVFAKRPLWTLGITIAVTVAFAAFLQALISGVAWVIRGFRASAPPAA